MPRTATTHLGFGMTFTPGPISPELVATLKPAAPVYVALVKKADPSKANRFFRGALIATGHLYAASLLAS